MGFSFDNRGHLCCDACPASDGVRKRRCPFGYCPSRALCKACYARTKASGEHTKAAHEACRVASEAYKAKEARRAALLAAGHAVRCSALNADAFTEGSHRGHGRVHVIFRRADGSEVGRYVTSAAYHAIAFGEPATPDDYAALDLGPVVEAPTEFSFR